MTFWQFYWEVIKRAFRGKFATAEKISALSALVYGGFVWWWQPTGPWERAVAWVPIAVFVITFFATMLLGLALAPYRMFTEERAKANRLQSDLDSFRQRESGAFANLANLRQAGVSMRNEGTRLTDPADVPEFIAGILAWNESVKAEIRHISPVESTLFATLDTYQPTYTTGQYLSAEHQKHVLEHTERLRRLPDVIRRCEQWVRFGQPQPTVAIEPIRRVIALTTS